MIDRLELVIQAMGWELEGFGGIGTMSNNALMSTLEMAWQAPHGRQMIQATVPPRARGDGDAHQEILEGWSSNSQGLARPGAVVLARAARADGGCARRPHGRRQICVSNASQILVPGSRRGESSGDGRGRLGRDGPPRHPVLVPAPGRRGLRLPRGADGRRAVWRRRRGVQRHLHPRAAVGGGGERRRAPVPYRRRGAGQRGGADRRVRSSARWLSRPVSRALVPLRRPRLGRRRRAGPLRSDAPTAALAASRRREAHGAGGSHAGNARRPRRVQHRRRPRGAPRTDSAGGGLRKGGLRVEHA